MRQTPSYIGLQPASRRASVAARGSSKKHSTRPEILLRSALWNKGLRYRKNKADLPGIPDIVFVSVRVVIFVDGDFWHGKDWSIRKIRLARGHNPDYWLRKIARNIRRDRERNKLLHDAGWTVVRVWESDVRGNIDRVVKQIAALIGNLRRRG